jgi:NADPH-dependent glutamate synthase beta subunit-like oxidoreductase/ferredoxin
MKITIDNRTLQVNPGDTIWEAAASHGIDIPVMCHHQGTDPHPSCMVCVVKDLDSGKMVPSCASRVQDGMHLASESAEVHEMRRQALELLLSDHVGDCEAPCMIACPARLDIPEMNRLIQRGLMEDALSVVREEIALPVVLGYICPAPCEKACRRKPIDEPVSICNLKRFTAQNQDRFKQPVMLLRPLSGYHVAVVGSGPAGLSAAFHLRRLGHAVTLFDKHPEAGGALRYRVPENILPKGALDQDLEPIFQTGVEPKFSYHITPEIWHQEILKNHDAVILASGFAEEYPIEDFGFQPNNKGAIVNRTTMHTSIPGVFGCGSVVYEQILAVRSVAQGKKAAYEAHQYLSREKQQLRMFDFRSIIGPLKEQEYEQYLKESSNYHRLDPAQGHVDGFTRSEAMKEAARCMDCDCRKPTTCKLRIYADQYGANRKRFALGDRKPVVRNQEHPWVVYEPEKCIKCGICVRITLANGGVPGLAFVGRGFDVQIEAPLHYTMEDALRQKAEACVKACPTGALASREGEFSIKTDEKT